MITAGSLFSGIGGADLGMQRAGMHIAWQVEVDEFCRRVLARHWPKVQRYEDVKDFPGSVPVEELRVDLIAGGFPCQPVSLMNQKQTGGNDDRWLWPEMRRVCQILRPRWVLVENVVGLLTAGDVRGSLLGGVLRDMATLGYFVEWSCIPAGALGAPHIRDRFWLLGRQLGGGDTGGAVRDQGADALLPRTALAYPGFPRLEGHAGDGEGGEEPGRFDPAAGGPTTEESLRSAAARSPWGTFCRLGGTVDGVPCGLDGCLGWECGVDRIATGQPDRKRRLTGLGNAVVPDVVQWIAEQVIKFETEEARR